MGLFSKESNIMSLVRREVVVHLHDGETTIRGFLMDFYGDGSIRIAKPSLMTTEAQNSEALGGEVLIFRDQIKFAQLL
jgi:hypothetical protein